MLVIKVSLLVIEISKTFNKWGNSEVYYVTQQENSGNDVFPVDYNRFYRLSKMIGDSRDQQIRDRIVIGILDKGVSQKLQLKSVLTLEVAIEITR